VTTAPVSAPVSAPSPVPLQAPAAAPRSALTRSRLLLVIAAVALSAGGQLLLRTGMDRASQAAKAGGGSLAVSAVTSPYVLVGLALFGLSSVLWLAALAKVPLSLAYPFTAVSYLLILAVSAAVLGEHVSPQRWLGALLVLGGLTVVVRSEPARAV